MKAVFGSLLYIHTKNMIDGGSNQRCIEITHQTTQYKKRSNTDRFFFSLLSYFT